MSTQPLNRVVREFLTQLVATGAPETLDKPISSPGIRLQLHRRRLRGTDDALAIFAVRAPSSVTHYLYASSVICPDLPEADQALLREEVEAVLFRYLNPLDMVGDAERSLWLLSETEQSQMVRVLALSPEEEIDYIFLAGQNAQWTGPIRGLHKTMGALAQMFSRHPDFSTGKVVCRPPASFLFLGEAKALERLPAGGIGMDGRTAPTRGVLAIDTASYLDALLQLGEEEARGLTAAEFVYTGSCIRAHGPLGIPLYRIPHSIAAADIRSLTVVASGAVVYAAQPATVVPQV